MQLIGLFFYLLSVVLSFLALFKGWGLTPQSWPWLIGCYLGGVLCMGLGGLCLKSDD